jgi:thiol-disulfide isomerase/thioredoxin
MLSAKAQNDRTAGIMISAIQNRKRALLPMLFCTMLALMLWGKPAAGSIYLKKDTLAGPEKGKSLPDFLLKTADGSTIKLSSIKGEVVLIDFWASWCMPCRAAIPHLKELYKTYQHKGLKILSVSIDQNSTAWNKAMLKEAMPWPQVIDHYDAGKDASEMMISLGITSVPFMIVLNKKGEVEIVNPTVEQLDSLLGRLNEK